MGSVTVTAGAVCPWSATSNASWLMITSNSSGTGNGTVSYSASPNPTTTSRTGTLTIAGCPFTVSQEGASRSYSLSPTGQSFSSSGGTGTIFDQGTVVTLTATPDTRSIFEGWSGGCSGVSPTCSLTLNSDTTVTATFNLKTFTINASAEANGSISPQGTIKVTYGASQSSTITAATGYQVSDVKVDAVSAGTVSTYQFANVVADHTIAASFAPLPPPPEPGSLILALNAGGPEYLAASGFRYQSDRYFLGGATQKTDLPIQGTTDISLYQTERYGNFSYSIPLANGNYDLTLKFVETMYSSRGQRIFDVFVEGKAVLTNLDIYSAAGSRWALDVAFTVSVVDGVLDLHFVSKVGEAKINALLSTTPSNIPKKVPGKLKRYFSTQSRTRGP